MKKHESKKEVLAIDYYEEREADLGFDFAAEVYAAIGRAVEHPKSWPILDGEVRRCQTGMLINKGQNKGTGKDRHRQTF